MLWWLSFTWQEMSCTIKNRITIDITLQLNHNWTYNVNLFCIAQIHWKLCFTIFPGGEGGGGYSTFQVTVIIEGYFWVWNFWFRDFLGSKILESTFWGAWFKYRFLGVFKTNVSLFRVISFKAFWKFYGSEIRHGIFCIVGSPRELLDLNFAPIQSSLSLEIRITPTPPDYCIFIDCYFFRERINYFFNLTK